MKSLTLITALFAVSLSSSAAEFVKGPTIGNYGQHAAVSHPHTFSDSTQFKIAFDVAQQASEGEVNRKFNSLARFINMHAANGVKADNIHLALVVHGKAIFDLLKNEQYQAKMESDNANAGLIKTLLANQVSITVCGQSAAYYELTQDDFVSGVTVSLSAMTAHALLQQDGYTVNPF